MTETRPCPFCELPETRIVESSRLGLVIRDAYPISPGHTLVIPRRHVGSFFELHGDERADILGLLDSAKAELDKEFKPQAYTGAATCVIGPGSTYIVRPSQSAAGR